MQQRNVPILVTDEEVKWIEEIYGVSFNKWMQDHVTDTVKGRDLSGMPRHRISIAWIPEVYEALVQHAAACDQSYATFVRETVQQMLRRKSDAFRFNPEAVRSGPKNVTGKQSAAEGRNSCSVPLMFPEAWWEEMKRMGYTTSHIKAWVQHRLERELGRQFTVQHRLQKYLDDPHWGANV